MIHRRPRAWRLVAPLTAALVVAGVVVAAPAAHAAPGAAAADTAAGTPVAPGVLDPCAPAAPPSADAARCFVVTRAQGTAGAAAARTAVATTPTGITPSQLRAAYGVGTRQAPAGTTVGVVVAYDAPRVEADLAAYRSAWGLGACTTANGCFRKVDQRGRTVPVGKSAATAPTVGPDSWQLEATLDVQAVSATCPTCDILLVEADGVSTVNHLGPAVRQAAALGATVISNSFGAGESAADVTADRTYWSKLAVPVFAATGDHAWNNLDLPSTTTGYNYANYPAVSPSVVAVGGTSATLTNGVLTDETAWADGGSGCSVQFPRPAWQSAYFDLTGTTPHTGRCTLLDSLGGGPARVAGDVSAIADPRAPGFSVYRAAAGGWVQTGGTSLSVQIVAALAAYAGARPAGSSVNATAYALAGLGAPTGLVDLTTGTNRTARFGCAGERVCTAATGWDGPTGLGSPVSPALFAPLATLGVSSAVPLATVAVTGSNLVPGETVTVTAPGATPAETVVDATGAYRADLALPAGLAPGTVQITATGATSKLTARRPLTVPAPAVTPPSQRVVTGQPVSLSVSGFGAGETVDVTSGGQVLATATTTNAGAATPTWIPQAVGTRQVVVTGEQTGRTVSAVLAVLAVNGATPEPPTVLSATPTVDGGALVGVRTASTGSRATSVTVLGSDGSVSGPVTAVSAVGDAFVTVAPPPPPTDGSTPPAVGPVTYTAVAGNDVGDSYPSLPSQPVTAGTEPGTGDLTPVGPVRLYDSRLVNAPLRGGATRSLTVAGVAGVPAQGASAVVLSVTLVAPSARSYLSVWPAGQARPVGASTNVLASKANKAALVKVGLGTGGAVSFYYDSGTAGLVVDVVGFYAAASAGTLPAFAHSRSFAPVTPVRALDTRLVANSPVRSGNATISVPVRSDAGGPASVPASAAAVEVVVQAVGATTQGYVTVFPTGTPRPIASNVQAVPGVPVATSVLATVGSDGRIDLYTYGRTDLLVDVVGWYGPEATGRYIPVSPRRYLDTRPAQGGRGPVGTNGTLVVPVAGAPARDGSQQVPTTATAVSFVLAAVDNSLDTYLTAWSGDVARPAATAVLAQPAHTLADNLTLSAVSTTGRISVWNRAGNTQVIVDVQGYYVDASTLAST